MFVSFAVLEGHPLSRELSGGRVRTQSGEDAVAAVVRRIEQDTRCRVVVARRQGPVGEGAAGEYEVTLRGCLPESRGRPMRIEGAIRVRLHPGYGPLGPSSPGVAQRLT